MLSPDLDVPYFSQPPTSQQCGAACAQMVLAEIGVTPLNQSTLFAEIQSNNVGVRPSEPDFFLEGSGPRGLKKTMNDHYPAGRTGSFRLISEADKDKFSQRLVRKLYSSLVPSVVLVYRQQHWVVVTRCDTDKNPLTSDNITIKSFDVSNPRSDSPVTCLKGGVANIAYANWIKCYLRSTESGGGEQYNNEFWAICATDLSGKRFRGAPTEADEPEEIASIPPGVEGDAKTIAADVAVQSAIRALKDFGLSKRPPWDRVLAYAKPGAPRLVKELDSEVAKPGAKRPGKEIDDEGDLFYIVPWMTSEGLISMTVSVDAVDGSYRESEVCPAGGLLLPALLSPGELSELVVGKTFELPDQKGQILIRREDLSFSPTLVWRPCIESFSPHLPFNLMNAKGHNLYVLPDGKVVTSLNVEARGY
jgi:hypothetical protein